MSNNLEKKRLLVGKVISRKMSKTATVEVERVFRDIRVHKVVRSKRKFQVHDPKEITEVGDKIEFYEGCPISKTKFMYLYRVVSKSEAIGV